MFAKPTYDDGIRPFLSMYTQSRAPMHENPTLHLSVLFNDK